MFGFGDMAMGSAMEMNGAMDMADGMMLTEMGMPGLGAMEMGIGAMEMGMGQNMMAMGMMENMYGGYGMGMGYGMGGMMAMDTALMVGCMGLGCTLACCNPGVYRRGCMGMGCTLACCKPGFFRRACMGIGCNLACCAPRRRLGNCIGIGCTGPCCVTTTTEVIIVNGNNNQYQYPQQQQYQNQVQYQYQNGYQNQQQYQNRPQQQYQNQQYQNQQYQQNPPQQYQQNPPQQYQNQQYQNPPQQYQNQSQYQNNNYSPNQPTTNQTQPQQQQNYKPNPQQINNYQPNLSQKTPQQQVPQILDQTMQQKQFKQQAKTTMGYPQVSEYKKRTYQIQQKFSINNQFASEELQDYKSQVAFSQQQYIPNTQNYVNPNVVYQGHLLKRHGINWTEHPSAILTRTHLIDQPLNFMTKLKVKMDLTHQNSCFMKVTMNNTQDHFYGCYKNQQLDWFCSIVWAKMTAIGKTSDRYAPFTGFIEGSILRKSQFLGNWEFRHVKIDASGLRSYQNLNSIPTLNLCAIKELWTRFEYMNGGNYLVVKCKCDGTKYQYGIPVEYAFPWIRAFYSLLV